MNILDISRNWKSQPFYKLYKNLHLESQPGGSRQQLVLHVQHPLHLLTQEERMKIFMLYKTNICCQELYSLIGIFQYFQPRHLGSNPSSPNYQIIILLFNFFLLIQNFNLWCPFHDDCSQIRTLDLLFDNKRGKYC